MKRPISILSIMIVGIMSAVPSDGVQMTAQIRRLLDQKEEKIKQLEACEGKKRGWMIAGISTIGLTAVGVGVNIAQASKSNKLSSEIDIQKQTLERQQNRLAQIQQNNTANTTNTTKEKNYYDIGLSYYEIDGETKVVDECEVSNPGEWCVVFPYDDDAVIKGQAVCNNIPKTSSSEQTDPDAQYCWCKMTQPLDSRWVFLRPYHGSCEHSCAHGCAYLTRHSADLGDTFGVQ